MISTFKSVILKWTLFYCPLSMLVLLSSCTTATNNSLRPHVKEPPYYRSNAINARSVNKKGDFKIGLSLSRNKRTSRNVSTVFGAATASSSIGSIDFQTSYAFSRHFLASFNGMYSVDANFGFLFTGEPVIFRFSEFGVGYYNTFADVKSKLNMHFEFQVGIGKGLSPRIYRRTYFQPAFGFSNQVLDFSIACRLAFIDFNPQDSRGLPPELGLEQLKFDAFNFATIEPMIHIALGGKKVRVFMQIASITSLGKKNIFQWAANVSSQRTVGIKGVF